MVMVKRIKFELEEKINASTEEMNDANIILIPPECLSHRVHRIYCFLISFTLMLLFYFYYTLLELVTVK